MDHAKNKHELNQNLKNMFHNDPKALDFSASVAPLIAMQAILLFIVFINNINILREIFSEGILSWQRNNFGDEFC